MLPPKQPIAIDERGARARARGRERRGQAAGTAADHQDVGLGNHVYFPGRLADARHGLFTADMALMSRYVNSTLSSKTSTPMRSSRPCIRFSSTSIHTPLTS